MGMFRNIVHVKFGLTAFQEKRGKTTEFKRKSSNHVSVFRTLIKVVR